LKGTFDINKSPNAIKTRILTLLPDFGQIKSNIALRIYRVVIVFVLPMLSAGPVPL
jgi:hypothetical protein